MMRLRRICVGAIAAGMTGMLLTSGPAAAATTTVSEPHYSLYVDFIRLGKLSINPTTHECTVEGAVPLKGQCTAESTFSAKLFVASSFAELGLEVEGIPHRNERVVYAGRGRLNLEFAGKPRVWVEVRNTP